MANNLHNKESHGSTPCEQVHPNSPHDGWSNLHEGKWCTFIHPNQSHTNSKEETSDRLENTVNSLLETANKYAQESNWGELKNTSESILFLQYSEEAKKLLENKDRWIKDFVKNYFESLYSKYSKTKKV